MTVPRLLYCWAHSYMPWSQEVGSHDWSGRVLYRLLRERVFKAYDHCKPGEVALSIGRHGGLKLRGVACMDRMADGVMVIWTEWQNTQCQVWRPMKALLNVS